MMAGMELSSRSIREQIASAVQLIVYQQRLKDGTRRFTHVTEVAGMEGEVITLQDIFLFDFSAGIDDEGRFRGRLKSTGLRPKFLDKLAERGVYVDPEVFALEPTGKPDDRRLLLDLADGADHPRRRSSAGGRVLLAWFLLGNAARMKKDREVEARMRAVMQPGGGSRSSTVAPEAGSGWIPSNVTRFGRRFAESRGFSERLDAQLEAAGVSLRSGEFVVASVGAALVCGLLGAALLRSALLALVLAAGRAVPAEDAARRRAQEARGPKLREQLPDVLTIMAASLRAGHSFLQSLDTVAKEIAAARGVRVPAGRRGDPTGPACRGRPRGAGRARRRPTTSSGRCWP